MRILPRLLLLPFFALTLVGCSSLPNKGLRDVAVSPEEYSDLSAFIDAIAAVQQSGGRCFFRRGTSGVRLYLRLSPMKEIEYDVLYAMGYFGGPLVALPAIPEEPAIYAPIGVSSFTVVASNSGNSLYSGRGRLSCTVPKMMTEIHRNDLATLNIHKSMIASPVALALAKDTEIEFLLMLLKNIYHLKQTRHVLLVGQSAQ